MMIWENTYISLDALYTDSMGYETWAESELESMDSKMNQLGLKIVKKLSKSLTIYYGYDFFELKKNPKRLCPNCKQPMNPLQCAKYPTIVCEKCLIACHLLPEDWDF
jgi:predicted  nucleic acid-binding Zn ribbon protein